MKFKRMNLLEEEYLIEKKLTIDETTQLITHLKTIFMDTSTKCISSKYLRSTATRDPLFSIINTHSSEELVAAINAEGSFEAIMIGEQSTTFAVIKVD